MFWEWLLKYSSFFVTGIVSFFVSYLVWHFTTRRVKLIYYLSHTQFVNVPNPNPSTGMILGTATLFLENQGDAPSKNVQIAHYNPSLPFHNVFPDIQRNIINLPGGGTVLNFPVVPPKTLIIISYLLPPPSVNLEQLISYVISDEGVATRIPVMLQRVFPKWVNTIVSVLLLMGVWVCVNMFWSLVKFLWTTYYR